LLSKQKDIETIYPFDKETLRSLYQGSFTCSVGGSENREYLLQGHERKMQSLSKTKLILSYRGRKMAPDILFLKHIFRGSKMATRVQKKKD
jgi:hypothetical protein